MHLFLLILIFFVGIFKADEEVDSAAIRKIKQAPNTKRLPDDLTAKESQTPRFHDHDYDAIYFPSASSPQNSGKVGDRCISFYGATGSCQPMSRCYQEVPPFQTQLLRDCGYQGRYPLVCCPDSAIVKTKPISSSASPMHVIPDKKPLTVSPTIEKPTSAARPASANPVDPPARVHENSPTIPNSKVPPTSPALATPSSGSSLPGSGSLISPVSSTAEFPAGIEYKDSQQLCGVYNQSTLKTEIWPWIVSIGHRDQARSIRWKCLGSLITRDFILTSALCLLEDPNVIGLGVAMLGPMSESDSEGVDIRSISQATIHEKFIKPYLYKNIGLVQISPHITVSPRLLPICFPFLASVLDILQFAGSNAKTVGFEFPVDGEVGLRFRQEEYRVIRNNQCARVITARKSQTIERFPRGLQPDSICGLKKTVTSICQAPGAPLVLYDDASSSYVLIGIASGDPTCGEFRRQLVTFTRMNSYSTWVRERVGTFPTPPPCYY